MRMHKLIRRFSTSLRGLWRILDFIDNLIVYMECSKMITVYYGIIGAYED
jgi:hypothetical protein